MSDYFKSLKPELSILNTIGEWCLKVCYNFNFKLVANCADRHTIVYGSAM
jgi:hypothetical protein